jgi:hypothetical protein
MHDAELRTIFQDIHQKHFRAGRRSVEAVFHPYRSLRHTIQWNTGNIHARVSNHFRTAPRHILEILALILLSKVYQQRVNTTLRKIYRAYTQDLMKNLAPVEGRSVAKYVPTGRCFDLGQIFRGLNSEFFGDRITVENIGWSMKKSYRRLGFYDTRRDLLVISRIFDHPRVPEEVVRFLVYHEMLHVSIPERMGKGRRILHPPEFRRREREFPRYQEIDVWIKRNLIRL